MALRAYDPTRGYLVPVSQARVVAYVIDTETGKRYSTVAEAEKAIAEAKKAIAEASAVDTPKPKTITSTTYEGSGKNRVKVTKYSDGTEERVADPEAVDTAGKRVITGSGTKGDPLKVDGKVFTGTLPENNVYYENGVVFVYTPPASESKTTADLTPTDKTSFDKTISEIVSSGGKTNVGYTFGTPTGEPMPGSVVPSATGMKTFNYIPVSSMSEAQKRTYGIVLTDPNIDAVFFDQDTGTMYYRFKNGSRGSGDKGAFYRDPLGNIRPSSEIPYNYSTGFYPSGSGGIVSEPYAPFGTYAGVSGVNQPGTLATGSQPYVATGEPSFTNVSSTLIAPSDSTSTGAGRGLARDTFKNTLALFFGTAEAAKPWTDALYAVVNKYFKTGSTAEESFNLALQEARTNPELKPFADRFKGIFALQDMRQQGKPVLVPTIGEYVASQAGMSNLLTQAGLGNLATEEFTGDLIGKGNSVSTIADKINQAFTRIDLAPKAIKDTLSRYYPTVDRSTLARTILTGEKGVQQLVDELAQYEVLAAAEQQGIGALGERGIKGGVDLARAQEYARAGQTFSSLLPKFGQISRAMPEVSRLAGISRREDIGQAGIEKAVISQSAKELAELEKISLEEEARFKTRAGRAELGLASQRRANRAF